MEIKRNIIVETVPVVSLTKSITDLNNEAASNDTECDWSTLMVTIEEMTEGILSGSTVLSVTVQTVVEQPSE